MASIMENLDFTQEFPEFPTLTPNIIPKIDEVDHYRFAAANAPRKILEPAQGKLRAIIEDAVFEEIDNARPGLRPVRPLCERLLE